MNKKLIAVAAAGLLIAGTAVLIVINHRPQSGAPQESSDVSDQSGAQAVSEQESAAPFDFVCSDRLCGYPETDRICTDESIEVVFADAGTIRKEYGDAEGENQISLTEASAYEINGMNVTLGGENGMIQYASWSYNGFDYTISINDIGNSVSAEEMTDYIVSTR